MNGSALALLANSNHPINATQGVYEVCKSHLQIPSNDQSRNVYQVSDSAFDEEFEVRDDETVKTPRSTSPSIDELIRKLPSMNPNKLPRSPISYGYPRFESGMRFRSLAELACKPSPYPLEKLYDESIPVRTTARSINESSRIITSSVDKPKLTKGSITRHPSVRLLDNVQSRPSNAIPMRSMSSAGLIGDFTGLSFQIDAFSLTDGFLSIPSASKFIELDQSFLNDTEQSNKRDTTTESNVVDTEKQGHSENNVDKDHEVQVERTDEPNNPSGDPFHPTDATIVNQTTQISKASTLKLLDKKKVSSSNRKRVTSTKKTKPIVDSSTEVGWPDASLLSPPSFPTTSDNQEKCVNSEQRLVITIENSSLDDNVPYTCDDKIESHSNDSGNHSISSNSEINLPLNSEPTANDYAVSSPTNYCADHEPYFLGDHLNEDLPIADEEFTLVTNKKMRKKQRSQIHPNKTSPVEQSNSSSHSSTNGCVVRPPNRSTRTQSQSVLNHASNIHNNNNNPRISTNRIVHKPDHQNPNSISFSTNGPKTQRSYRSMTTISQNRFISSIPSTSSHMSSSVCNLHEFPKSTNHFKKDRMNFKHNSKPKEIPPPNHRKSVPRTTPKPPPPANNSPSTPSHLVKSPVKSQLPAPFCPHNHSQHQLLVQFLISSWKSFQSNTRTQ